MRFGIRPSQVLAGAFVVIDADRPDMVARRNGRPLIFPDRLGAAKACDSLNRHATRRRVCRVCRHKAPALDVVDGACPECRTQTNNKKG